jgi:hypothetical protein
VDPASGAHFETDQQARLHTDTAYYFGFFKKVQVAQPLHALVEQLLVSEEELCLDDP